MSENVPIWDDEDAALADDGYTCHIKDHKDLEALQAERDALKADLGRIKAQLQETFEIAIDHQNEVKRLRATQEHRDAAPDEFCSCAWCHLVTERDALKAEVWQLKKNCTEHMIDLARTATQLTRYKAALTLTPEEFEKLASTSGVGALLIRAWIADRRRAAEGG